MNETMTAWPGPQLELDRASEIGNALLDQLNRMRERDPITYSEENGGIWIVTGHRQVAEGFACKVPLSSRRLPDLVMTQISAEDREARYR